MALLRSGHTLADKENFTIGLTYELNVDVANLKKGTGQVTLDIVAKDFAPGANTIFFGDRPLDNPGYSNIELLGKVGVGVPKINRLDVYRVEQRLKYFGFGSPTGIGSTTGGEFKVDGSFDAKDKNALKHFEKIVRFRAPTMPGYGTMGDDKFSGELNGADGKIAPDDKSIIADDAASGTSLEWLNAYNAPHWMNILRHKILRFI